MRTIYFIALFIIATLFEGLSQTPSLDITYLGNEGFLIYSKNKKILVDALFKLNMPSYAEPSETMIKKMIGNETPYNNIDLLLITHHHGDHFNPDLTISFLENQPACKLVAPKQVVDGIRGLAGFDKVKSRIVEISTDTGSLFKIIENDIYVDILCTRHSGDTEYKNMSFIANLEGSCFFHCGDATIQDNIKVLQKYSFNNKPVDILFLQSYDTSFVSKQFVAKTIKPDMIIAMHISPEEIETDAKTFMTHYPFGRIFKKLEQSMHFTNTVNYHTLSEPYLGVDE
jgi:L-ascorbate metabolism protein UlaG (beta-lactamase superfamily)